MRQKLLKLFAATGCLIFLSGNIHAQGFSFNCSRDTIIPGCNPVCFTLKGIIPDIYGTTSSYVINPTSPIAGCAPVYVQPDDPTGTSTNLLIDDKYSDVINIGFPFQFYGTTYTQLIASTNGYVSFDISKANGFAHWSIGADLPSATYDRAMIMGPYHDLHPFVGTSPSNRVQYQLFGVAPHRRWILSFYRVPLFSGACNALIENTHQIVLYESTGVIEVVIFSKQICPGWNNGRAIVGIQDWNRTQGLMAPGRAAIANGPWSVSLGATESWRFEPAAGPSLFKRVELLDVGGSILSTGTTVPAGPGRLEASFPNTCVPGGPSTYIIRSVYTKNDDPLTEIFGVDTVRVTRATTVAATTTTNSATCVGANDGTITVTPSSGTPPFSYSLDLAAPVTGPSPYTFNGIAPGPHTIDITDNNGCTLQLNVNVATGPAMVTAVNKTDALCNGTLTGTITVTPPTIGTHPYSYSLDGITWQASNVFNGLPAGNYTVHYRSSDICPGSTNITITEPPVLSAVSANTNGTCDGGADGTITVTANGGTASYQYSIDGTTFQASNVFNVVPGNYTVTVKDNQGCITTFNTVVGLNDNLSFTPQTDPTICEGRSTQLSLTTNATGFAWTPRIGLSDTAIYNPVANPVLTTEYHVRATLGVCFIIDTVIVNVHAAPVPNAGPDGFICYGQTYQLQASGGGTQYAWSPSTFLNNPNIDNPVSTPTKDITYTLSVLSDPNGCASLVTDQIRIDVTPPIKVKTFPYDTIGYSNDQFQLLAIPSDTDVINFSWSPATGLSDPTIANPVVTVGATGDVVTYRVTTTTLAGCRGDGFITIRVYKGPDIYMPTGFTPNGDGRNDRFTPFPVGIKSYKYFRVFNRWGQMVFSTAKMHNGWDGKLDGRDQASGTYVWMIEGLTKDNKVITKKGVVTLIR